MLYTLPAGYVLALTGQSVSLSFSFADPHVRVADPRSSFSPKGCSHQRACSDHFWLPLPWSTCPWNGESFVRFVIVRRVLVSLTFRSSLSQVFKSFSVETLFMAGVFSQSMKLGHYIKIPPRNVFFGLSRSLLPRARGPSTKANPFRAILLPTSPSRGRLHFVPRSGRNQAMALRFDGQHLPGRSDELAHLSSNENLLHRFGLVVSRSDRSFRPSFAQIVTDHSLVLFYFLQGPHRT